MLSDKSAGPSATKGYLSPFSIYRIREKLLMETLVPKLNEVLPQEMKVEYSDFGSEGYIFNFTRQPLIKLFCSHKVLLTEFGGKILNKNSTYNPNVAAILKECVILNDERSYQAVITKLESVLDNVLVEYNFENKEALIEYLGQYYIINLVTLINHFKTIGVANEEKTSNRLEKLLKNIRAYSKFELANLGIPSWIPWKKILPQKEEELENLSESKFDIFYNRRSK
jgi:hypothetical protein